LRGRLRFPTGAQADKGHHDSHNKHYSGLHAIPPGFSPYPVSQTKIPHHR
jgi:hypothetical protein